MVVVAVVAVDVIDVDAVAVIDADGKHTQGRPRRQQAHARSIRHPASATEPYNLYKRETPDSINKIIKCVVWMISVIDSYAQDLYINKYNDHHQERQAPMDMYMPMFMNMRMCVVTTGVLNTGAFGRA